MNGSPRARLPNHRVADHEPLDQSGTSLMAGKMRKRRCASYSGDAAWPTMRGGILQRGGTAARGIDEVHAARRTRSEMSGATPVMRLEVLTSRRCGGVCRARDCRRRLTIDGADFRENRRHVVANGLGCQVHGASHGRMPVAPGSRARNLSAEEKRCDDQLNPPCEPASL